jgi:hypothetical protein
MPVSIRQQSLARKAAQMQAPPTKEYEIVDPSHRPDLRGQFAGQPVLRRGLKQIVRLTDAQAKFYMDQGGIVPYVVTQPEKVAAAPPRR